VRLSCSYVAVRGGILVVEVRICVTAVCVFLGVDWL